MVQGVGFRPFIYRLANEYGLNGWVLNSDEGVVIDVEGDAVDQFTTATRAKAPPLARIESLEVTILPPIGYESFLIKESQNGSNGLALISPDIAVCSACLQELFDPHNHRYRYPFINCTDCGPRFTITRDIPYDRINTTMATFTMCPTCAWEYHEATDRRFHAQPNACPICGPKVWLVPNTPAEQLDCRSVKPNYPTKTLSNPSHAFPGSQPVESFTASRAEAWGDHSEECIEATLRLLCAGYTVAVKGIGGFHLACDATNDTAVARLRWRKGRVEKPFALMSPDVATVETYCYIGEEERALLESAERPIVLLRRRTDGPISSLVAPGNNSLGVMLPYSPLHHLLLAAREGQNPPALVMTSGNVSEEPIAISNAEALECLSSIADAFLLHNRDIYMRCDDSVARIVEGEAMLLRRSRGYVPSPVELKRKVRPVLACGAELKNAFCLTKGTYAFLSQHIGDLQNMETLRSFEAAIEHFKHLFRIEPQVVAHDLHPDYLSTKYAESLDRSQGGATSATKARVAVQHHHAHIASCMAENGLDEAVIGVAFDGTGYGSDGAIWGGEFLVCTYKRFQRWAHLKYVPMPGGEVAIRKPYRMALSHLVAAYGDFKEKVLSTSIISVDPLELDIIQKQLQKGLNAPLTSSCGRLFDAVAALLGLRQIVNYEGQAAIELEMIAAEDVEGDYEWGYNRDQPLVLDAAPVIRGIIADLCYGLPEEIIAAKFHNAVVQLIITVCQRIREREGLDKVLLSGGVFQNLYLLKRVLPALRQAGFQPFIQRRVPCNDGGIALGQAMVADAQMED
ncbi:MAG: carbamoyltransferase HypF [Chloroflexi bacterium]|nr:carbamoyltransferase HypF [Chloroflexota bacterium]MCL5075444.1 carbamoyltransferase HypF [Chloroflexota bacterium]